ncbi:hypothetical protein G7K71_04850 [Desulfofundulus sp. TPOSR]|uniref:hypothetical protein n=1 Tax=Desulfofundulus sp. TPOSR TaxID=2714340 RepID=UPI00140CE06F|nr:hypothetical protein [Desulfofundulus sp. TPOSR]NHM26332.1 hypothetical protein [Desulfofundulus sp. TPOSR]
MKSSQKKNNETIISAYVGGQLKKCGVLKQENGRYVFEQRIRERDILKIRGAAGVDLRYEPPLPEDCIIRHVISESGSETVFEIPLQALKQHPKMDIASIGPKHPKRMYLSYRFWRNRTLEEMQPRLFEAV